jgi:hypothetical protein
VSVEDLFLLEASEAGLRRPPAAVFVAMCRRRIQICEYAAGRRNITVVAETVFAKAGLALRVFQSAEFRNSSHTFSRAAMS